ncbi:MAG: N-acetyltransferase [Proteobacteria bacterium]|nr:MAG: N-acetyltransferase [Pseudomonadota bacterium]
MTEADKLAFAGDILNETYDIPVIDPIDETAALKAIVSDINELFDLNLPDVLESRYKHFQVPQSRPEDYREQLFELKSGRTYLAGIRHAGANPNLPFVQITSNFVLGPHDLSLMKRQIHASFEVFNPLHLAYWAKSESSQLELDAKPARRYLASRISQLELVSSVKVDGQLERVRDQDYWQGYVSGYAAFHMKHPDLKSWVTVSDKEDLERYRSQALLFEYFVEGKPVGLIGAEHSDLLGLKGLYMGELLIHEQFKGRGYAVQMQREFLKTVGDEFEVVWGTIDARNLPSTKTALRVGRRPMRVELMVPLI